MKRVVPSCAFLLKVAIFGATSLCLPALALAEDSAGCSIINCDCDNVSAGLLTKSWRRDCMQCEKRLQEVCSQYSPPLVNGLRKAGACEDKCVAAGPNPYPKAVAASSHGSKAGEPPLTAPEEGVELVTGCPPNMERMGKMIDGKELTGCVGKDGLQQGLWIFVDKARHVIVEVIYKDGQEISRRESPLQAE